MNEIIRQLSEYSVPKILLTRYTLKFKEEKCLFNPIVFFSTLTKPCISPEVWINREVFPSKRKICLMNRPKEELQSLCLSIRHLSQMWNWPYIITFSIFWVITLRVHIASPSSTSLSAFHRGTRRNDSILSHSISAKIRNTSSPSLQHIN